MSTHGYDDRPLSRKRKPRGRPFVKGPDARRHELTAEERRRGGLNCWARTMAEVRMSMELPLPLEDVRKWARYWAREWLARHRAE